jgi:hypothetical protein
VKEEAKKERSDTCRLLFDLIKALTLGQHFGVMMQLAPKRLRIYEFYRSLETHSRSAVSAAFPNDKRANLATQKRQLLNQISRYLYLTAPYDGIRDLDLLIGEAKRLKMMGQNEVAIEKIDLAIKYAIGMEAMHQLLLAIAVRRSLVASVRGSYPDKHDYRALERMAFDGVAEGLLIGEVFSRVIALRTMPVPVQYQEAS